MSEYGFTKKDWALFREKISDWQEAYMNKLNKEVKNEELLYLMIHINRIIEKEKIKKETSIHE